MTRKGLLLFASMCVIWGIPYLLIRVAVGEISPVMLVFARTGIGALILMPIVLARGGLRGIGRKWIPLLAFAALEIGVPWFCLSSAEQHISSSLAGLLISSVPLVGTLVAPLFGNREGIGPVGIGGLALGIVGVAAIVGLDLHASDTRSLVEMALVAIGYALGPAVLRRYLTGVPSVSVIGISLAACAVAYAPLAAMQWPHAMPGRRSARIGRRAGGRVHRHRIPALLRADRRNWTCARHRDHLHQPGGRGTGRGHHSARDVHGRNGNRFRSCSGGFRPGHPPPGAFKQHGLMRL